MSQLADTLKGCRSLADAQRLLHEARGLSLARAWGLWDGWAGRPRTTAGLGPQDKIPRQAKADYLAACDEGARLSLEELP